MFAKLNQKYLNFFSSFKFLFIAAFVFGSSFSVAQVPVDDCYRHSIFSSYKQMESTLLAWQSEYERAPSGSQQERCALDQVRASRASIASILQDTNSLMVLSLQCVEGWGLEAYRSYQSARSGSTVEATYLEVARRIFSMGESILRSTLSYYLPTQSVDYFVSFTEYYYQNYQRASSGSQPESFYLGLARATGALIDQKLQMLSGDQNFSFNSFQSIGQNYFNKYRSAPSGSLIESIYLKISRTTLSLATQRFERDANFMDRNQLYQILVEYEQLYRSAPSGSLIERFYLDIRNIAHRHLNP